MNSFPQNLEGRSNFQKKKKKNQTKQKASWTSILPEQVCWYDDLLSCWVSPWKRPWARHYFLYLRLCKIGVFPNAGQSWRGLLFPFVQHASLLHAWCDFFHWSGRRSYPSWSSAGGRRYSWIPLIHNTNHPLPKGRKRFVLFFLHFCVYILIKYGFHLYEKEEKPRKKKKKKKKRRREGPRSMIARTLLFNCYGLKNKGKMFWTKTATAKVHGSIRLSKSSIFFAYFTTASMRSLYLLLSLGRFITAHNEQESYWR